MDNKFELSLEGFLKAVKAKAGDYTFRLDRGPKYIRVVSSPVVGCGSSAYCFINKQTGDVLKSASWKFPAKGVRSNIYADDFGASGVTEYGAVYFNR